MARRRRKRETRPADQSGYDACISWQRIFVGTMMVDRDLTVPVAGILQDTRVLLSTAAPCPSLPVAKAKLREGWGHLSDGELWFAVVCALDARLLLNADDGSDRRAEEGRLFCNALRSIYPKAPPGFDRCGHSATGGE